MSGSCWVPHYSHWPLAHSLSWRHHRPKQKKLRQQCSPATVSPLISLSASPSQRCEKLPQCWQLPKKLKEIVREQIQFMRSKCYHYARTEKAPWLAKSLCSTDTEPSREKSTKVHVLLLHSNCLPLRHIPIYVNMSLRGSVGMTQLGMSTYLMTSDWVISW